MMRATNIILRNCSGEMSDAEKAELEAKKCVSDATLRTEFLERGYDELDVRWMLGHTPIMQEDEVLDDDARAQDAVDWLVKEVKRESAMLFAMLNGTTSTSALAHKLGMSAKAVKLVKDRLEARFGAAAADDELVPSDLFVEAAVFNAWRMQHENTAVVTMEELKRAVCAGHEVAREDVHGVLQRRIEIGAHRFMFDENDEAMFVFLPGTRTKYIVVFYQPFTVAEARRARALCNAGDSEAAK